jgi:hypothetical protein
MVQKDISPSSVSDKMKTFWLHKNLKVREVIAMFALSLQSRDLPNIATGINIIRETAVSFEVAVNRNW